MSAADDRAYLEAQRAFIHERLGRLGPEQKLLRINLESRLRRLDEEIAALETVAAIGGRAKASLVFGGNPVAEAGAIEATFGADALKAFQRLVSTTASTLGGRELGARGRIPDEKSYRLFVTGTFPGSFGFELEEMVTEPEQEPGVLRGAVDEASRLLQATQLEEEAYADAVAQSNPRVVRALASFLELMESRGATLRLAAGERECRFETPELVAAAAERARKTDIRESEERLTGVLSGVFAVGRQFEFQLDERGEVVRGRVGYGIADPASLKPYLWTRCVAHVWIVTVERTGKEHRTYYLTRIEPLPGDETEPEQR
ncbi:hypothetical protein WMF31_38535 [Sorangium sp. So ce1036]|uniref:hypothetical protein n=1 Tax=Sorangium sp. So ce1036 TaxID=3133328 RepID=UPI003EFF22E6